MPSVKSLLRADAPKIIHVWSQTRNKRVFVGKIFQKNGCYIFEYDNRYRRSKGAVPLGAEFPLVRKMFSSKHIFPTLTDRIPSKQNPAYADYCAQWAIDPEETDTFRLLTTIGRRGPSTFVFEPAVQESYDRKDVIAFRKRLCLSQQEFADLLGFNQSSLARIETGQTHHPIFLKYIEFFDKIPEVLQHLLQTRGECLHDEKREKILDRL